MSGPVPAEAIDLDELIQGIARWVQIESPTTEPAAVNRMMDIAAEELAALGAKIDRRAGNNGFGDSVIATIAGREPGPGVLVLAHLDTVHPIGTLAGALPFRRDGRRLYGPGVYDMKGGAYCALYALRKVIDVDLAPRLTTTFLLIPDEEFGSPSTRGLIEEQGRAHRYVLVPEPAQDAGKLITGRWAFQRFTVRVRGLPAHAGVASAGGRSAIREMSQQISRIEALSDPERNVSVSVGTVHGGTFVNVVPSDCAAEVLAVTPTQADFERVREQMLGLTATNGALALSVEPGGTRPLFAAFDGTMELYRRALAIAREIGFEPGHGSVGGGSDGNFTGAMGIPTLDGLGVCGDGFHTSHEHADIPSFVERTQLLSGLLRTLC